MSGMTTANRHRKYKPEVRLAYVSVLAAIITIAIAARPSVSDHLHLTKTCPHIGEKCQLTSNIQWVGAILKQQKRSPLSLKQSLLTSLVKVNLLIMAGDLELNPGPKRPIKYPCGECGKAVKWTHRAVQCDSCDIWLHKDCMGMCSTVYPGLQECSASWIC